MNDDLSFWYTADGQITVSSERFKHGTSSLKWQWSSLSASLTYNNPQAFRSLKWANNLCFAVWLYNDQETRSDDGESQKPLFIEFLTTDSPEPVASVWYHVDFQGWRPLGLRYALLPAFKNKLSQISGIRIFAPSNVASGVYYLNGITFNYKHATGPKSDYQQPWGAADYIGRLNDDPLQWLYNVNNFFQNRPWLEENKVNASDEDVDKLRDKWLQSLPYGTWSPSTKPETYASLIELVKPYGIQPNCISNVPLGKGGFYSPTNGVEIQPFLLGPLKRTATTYQCHCYKGTNESDEGRSVWALLLHLCDYLLEQGWAEGNGNMEGHLDIGYEIRNFPMCFVYIRKQLNEANRLQPVLASAIWIMYGHLLTEKETSIMSTDIIHNYLINVARLIACLSDRDELVRRFNALRYTLSYSFENRLHEPLALDGTTHHHWMCHFEYASYALPDIMKFATDLNDTEFRFSTNIRRMLRRSAFTLNFCLVDNEKIPPNLNARAGTCVTCNGINLTKKCLCVCNENQPYDPFVAGLLLTVCSKDDKSIKQFINDGVDPVLIEGHLTLNSTAACIHRRPNFYACIVGQGKYRRGLEIYGWLSDSNNYGQYARNCSIFLVPPNEQGEVHLPNAGCSLPGWNWSHWPGTTCLLKPRIELFEGYCNLTGKNWLAGGTSIGGRDGMFSNDFLVSDIAFRRSVYCFDNRITVLTTNIKLLQQDKRPVVTTLFQSNFSGLENQERTSFILDNEEKVIDFPYERIFDSHELGAVTDHRNVTYFLHVDENSNQSYKIILKRGVQEMVYCNQYYLIDPNDNPIIDVRTKRFREPKLVDNEKYFQTTTDNFGLGYIEHLNASDGTASFVYTILVGHDQLNQWMEEFSHPPNDPWASSDLSELPPSIILSKDEDKHIFFDRDTDTTCYTCYSNERLEVNVGLVRSFGQPCMSMVRGRGPGTIVVSIATTDFMLNVSMWMVLKGKWINPELISDNENDCVHVRSEIMDNGDTKVTVWQRIYMPVEFRITQSDE